MVCWNFEHVEDILNVLDKYSSIDDKMLVVGGKFFDKVVRRLEWEY